MVSDHDKFEIDLKGKRVVALVGSPNVGKSVIFGLLTGRYVTVANYPGTTVEVTEGLSNFDKGNTVVIDTPGMNSIIPCSEDERVARDILFEDGSFAIDVKRSRKVIVQVADEKNLRRSLQLALPLIEVGYPFVLDLNMHDEALQWGVKIDSKKLGQILRISVVETVATEKQGVSALLHAVKNASYSNYSIGYPEPIEKGIEKLSAYLPDLPFSKRLASILLLSDDTTFRDWLIHYNEAVKKILDIIDVIVKDTKSRFRKPISYIINRARRIEIDRIVKEVLLKAHTEDVGFAERLGNLMTSPIWGVPFLLAVLYGVYKFVGEFAAQTCVDFLENVVFGRFIIPAVDKLIQLFIPFDIVWEVFVGRYGLVSMGLSYSIAIILPIVSAFFICFGILEDAGYLPRLSIMVNRIFKKIGLTGKAVLPMVLGLGCDTMATLTTRILDTKKERVIATLLLALGVPCSAQLGVIMAMLGAVSARALLLVFGVVLSQMLLVGWLASKILKGLPSDFMLDIPPVRLPLMSNVLTKTYLRVKWFLKEAVPLFLLGTLILFVLDKFGLLKSIERFAQPIVVNFLNLPREATQSFIVGFLRRDYGAAGLYHLAQTGMLTNVQIVVSMVVITLFVPCLANFFVIIKERGLKTALWIVGFIFPFAILVGGTLNFILRYFKISF